MDSLVNDLPSVRLRLNSPVTKIQTLADDGVVVTTGSGEEFTGAGVIVTVREGLL